MGMRGIRVGMMGMGGIRAGIMGMRGIEGGNAGNQGENLRIRVEMMIKKIWRDKNKRKCAHL